MYQQGDYDIILSDCHMPEMDGFELAQKISTERQGDKPRIIAITADALDGAVQNCIDSGFDDYLTKPCPISSLKAKLEIAVTALPIEKSQAAQEGTIFSEKNISMSAVAIEILPAKETHFQKAQHLKREIVLELTGEDLELTFEILEAYLANTSDFDDLLTANQQSQLPKVKDLGHKIKSAIRYLGADELAGIAEKIEEYSDKENTEKLTELISTLGTGLEILAKEAMQWCNEISNKEVII